MSVTGTTCTWMGCSSRHVQAWEGGVTGYECDCDNLYLDGQQLHTCTGLGGGVTGYECDCDNLYLDGQQLHTCTGLGGGCDWL